MRSSPDFPRLHTCAMCVSAALGVLLLTACTSLKKPTIPGALYVITALQTSFYKYGPAQSFGPDFVLTKGQQVTMMDRAYGFSRVMTTDGMSGYISSEDMQPASLLPAATPPPKSTKPGQKEPGSFSGTGSGKPRHSEMQPTPGLPLFDVNDVPLPMPENEPPKTKPKFRAGAATPGNAEH